jgi:hypothetical protein
LNKVLRPLLSKYNIDADQLAVCFAGTCEPVPLGTTVANIQPRPVIVMTQQQFQDRKLLSKRDYQKEINATANLLNSEQEHSLPFHQHGDIAFYEVPLETEGKGLKLNATRSHSTNPRVCFWAFYNTRRGTKRPRRDADGKIWYIKKSTCYMHQIFPPAFLCGRCH